MLKWTSALYHHIVYECNEIIYIYIVHKRFSVQYIQILHTFFIKQNKIKVKYPFSETSEKNILIHNSQIIMQIHAKVHLFIYISTLFYLFHKDLCIMSWEIHFNVDKCPLSQCERK